jgi:hypothetical protein
LTTAPPLGAAYVSVTVPVEVAPPPTAVGESVRLETAGGGGNTERSAATLELSRSALIVAVAALDTAVVVTLNVADVWPAATVTVLGVVTPPMLLLRETVDPPDGAATLMLTVPIAVLPPTTVAGESDRPANTGGMYSTVRVAVLLLAYAVAVMVDVDCEATGFAVTRNVALVWPAGTVTLAGTVAAPVLLLDRATDSPYCGAAAERVTVPVDVAPPATELGESVTLVIAALPGTTSNAAALFVVPSTSTVYPFSTVAEEGAPTVTLEPFWVTVQPLGCG